MLLAFIQHGGYVYSKLTSWLALPIAVLLLAAAGIAQTPPQTGQQTPPKAATAATGATAAQATIRGRISDPSGALIPGTTITISNSNGQTVASATADAA